MINDHPVAYFVSPGRVAQYRSDYRNDRPDSTRGSPEGPPEFPLRSPKLSSTWVVQKNVLPSYNSVAIILLVHINVQQDLTVLVTLSSSFIVIPLTIL